MKVSDLLHIASNGRVYAKITGGEFESDILYEIRLSSGLLSISDAHDMSYWIGVRIIVDPVYLHLNKNVYYDMTGNINWSYTTKLGELLHTQ